ncbi:MAG: malate dehydrogenase (quinone) [Bdellovibrionota bacterium]
MDTDFDVVFIGAGVMSATLAVMLHELDPDLKMAMYERLNEVAEESSAVLNNAGTGHSGFCELNYTPESTDGHIETKAAVKINESFEISKQFWAHLVEKGIIRDPSSFIKSVPHMSLVWGEKNVAYLKKRYEALQKETLFQGMEYSDDKAVLKEWLPLVMKGRKGNDPQAATRMKIGTDVNFGCLSDQMVRYLSKTGNLDLNLGYECADIQKRMDGGWAVVVKNRDSDEKTVLNAKFVFIGAGGGALELLQKCDIPEADGFGGFPVGGMWLVSYNEELAVQHQAKVYGLAPVGSPPMSVPHLDTRVINGKRALLFGPFATFSTKFLKNGSWLDLPKSLDVKNILPMIETGLHNLPLVQYLIGQLRLSDDERIAALREYFPDVIAKDWTLEKAGQRVQVVKKNEKGEGVLQFGTELVMDKSGTVAALLGASPGASSAASIMVEVIEKGPGKFLLKGDWQSRMRAMIPSYGQKLNGNPALQNQVREWAGRLLKIDYLLVSEDARLSSVGESNAHI